MKTIESSGVSPRLDGGTRAVMTPSRAPARSDASRPKRCSGKRRPFTARCNSHAAACDGGELLVKSGGARLSGVARRDSGELARWLGTPVRQPGSSPVVPRAPAGAASRNVQIGGDDPHGDADRSATQVACRRVAVDAIVSQGTGRGFTYRRSDPRPGRRCGN
jgi:hypothetical protein